MSKSAPPHVSDDMLPVKDKGKRRADRLHLPGERSRSILDETPTIVSDHDSGGGPGRATTTALSPLVIVTRTTAQMNDAIGAAGSKRNRPTPNDDMDRDLSPGSRRKAKAAERQRKSRHNKREAQRAAAASASHQLQLEQLQNRALMPLAETGISFLSFDNNIEEFEHKSRIVVDRTRNITPDAAPANVQSDEETEEDRDLGDTADDLTDDFAEVVPSHSLYGESAERGDLETLAANAGAAQELRSSSDRPERPMPQAGSHFRFPDFSTVCDPVVSVDPHLRRKDLFANARDRVRLRRHHLLTELRQMHPTMTKAYILD